MHSPTDAVGTAAVLCLLSVLQQSREELDRAQSLTDAMGTPAVLRRLSV